MTREELERRGWVNVVEASGQPWRHSAIARNLSLSVAAAIEHYKDAALSAERERVVGLVRAFSVDGHVEVCRLMVAIMDGRKAT